MPKRPGFSRSTTRAAKRRRINVKRYKRRRRGCNAVPKVLRSLVEKKVYASSGSDGDVGTNGHFMYLNAGVAQGDNLDERDGRKVTFTKMQFRGTLSTTGSASTDPQDRFVRFLVFIDKTPVQEAATVTELIGTSNPHMSFRTWNESFRYKMLKDVTYRLPMKRDLIPSTDIESNVCGSKRISFDIPLKMHTEWLSTTGGTDQISKNSLVVMAISNLATSNVQLDWISRMQYVDL